MSTTSAITSTTASLAAISRPRVPVRVTVAIVALLLVVALSILAPVLQTHDPYAQNLAQTLVAPSDAHFFGTDSLGRDLFSRVLHGGRPPLLIATAAVIIALVVGVSLGLVAGYVGGVLDRVLISLSDIQLTVPGLVLALLILVLFGSSPTNVVIVIALESWPLHFRMVRSHTQAVRNHAYIEAALLSGMKQWRIVFRHILPGLLPLLMVTASMNFGGAMLAEASLSFLGMGIQPPTPDWGFMVADGQSQLGWAWWVASFPAAALLTVLLATQVLGNWLSDHFASSKE